MLQLAEKLQLARLSAGLNISEAAKKIGAKRSTYQYWEDKGPPLDEIPVITEALNLPDNYFFSNDPKLFEAKKLPVGDLAITLKDHFELLKDKDRLRESHEVTLKEYASIMRRIIEARLLPGNISSVEAETPSQAVGEEQDEHSGLLLSQKLGGKSEAPDPDTDQEKKRGKPPAKGK